MTGSLVTPEARGRIRGLAEPVALALGRLGLTPNALTLIGFLGTGVAAWMAASQAWLAAGVLVLVFGIFDLFDGTLARATGRANRLGAFLDSVFDRAGEAIVYVGITIGCLVAGFTDGALWATAAMGASFMVSYTRAKSEGLGFTTGAGMANVGVMPREVRIVVLALGLMLTPTPLFEPMPPNVGCAGPCDFQGGFLGIALVVIAAGATITTIQRIIHVLNQSGGDSSS